VLAAAFPALNRAGEGSSPSGPTDKHWSSSGQDPAPVMRRRRFESGPVLRLCGNLVVRAHDVTAACCLARAEERVRFPLGALDFRMWESLGFRVLRAHEIAGSNPAILTDAVELVLVRVGDC
jgi:hypothetical protein